ncbi:hypothetical protein BV133_1266 [Blastochloris viridis]|uniref:Uncharacterized protein n=1 Tax=Blastochloris viridis TaxID=1079 RepID=A0A182D099_BLAVI|nr:hypothetical protein BV133_1266 [Blastochloris viridis]
MTRKNLTSATAMPGRSAVVPAAAGFLKANQYGFSRPQHKSGIQLLAVRAARRNR